MDPKVVKLIAFDLDGTMTQHKTPLCAEHRRVLERLQKRYRLLMCGAGTCLRVFEQMGHFPLDIIGGYGMQEARYDAATKSLVIERDVQVPCDRDSVNARMTAFRQKHGFTVYRGDNVEFHAPGYVTLPLLGTAALPEDKLAFDPDRKKRRALYDEVKELFPEYNVFVGGSSSFDMAPAPYDKAYALRLYAQAHGYTAEQVAYVGDDYGLGGNDESVYKSEFGYVTIDDYRDFPRVMQPFSELCPD